MVNGFRGVLGSAAIQISMFLALFFVDAPKTPFEVEPYEGANEEVSRRLWWLRVILMTIHFFCFVGLLFVMVPWLNDTMITISRTFGVFSMLAQVFSLSMVSLEIFTKIEIGLDYSYEFSKFHHWFQAEIAVTLAGLASLFIFLLLRSFFRQRGVTWRMGGSFDTPATDFLDAQLGITSIIVTCTAPVFTVNYIR